MAFPVLLALVLVSGVAVVVFLGTRRRLSTWLLLVTVGFVVAGGVLWAHEPSHRHPPTVTPTAVITPAANVTSPFDVAGDYYAEHPPPSTGGSNVGTIELFAGDTVVPADTGSGPNHLPAIVGFALGGATGLVALVLKRRRPATVG